MQTKIYFFIFLLLIIIILLYFSITKLYNFTSKYPKFVSNPRYYIFSMIFLVLSFITISIWIFDIKYFEKKISNSVNWLDIVFVLDVSKSMNALSYKNNDTYYTWLDIAKNLIWDFVAKHWNDRFWLVIFAWDAISSFPLSTDHSSFMSLVWNIDYRNLNEQGTNIEKAINLWIERFNYSEDRTKVMIIISDWGDEDYKIDLESIKKSFVDKNIKNFVVWIWNKLWAKIALWNFTWRESYQKYNWEDVLIRINEKNLKDLSNSIKWEYIDIKDLDSINWNLEKLDKSSLKTWDLSWKSSINRFLAFLSFILFTLYIFFTFIRFKKNEK